MKIHFHIPWNGSSGGGRVLSESAQFGRDPRSDWRWGFIAFLVLNLLLIVLSVMMYRRVNVGDIFLVDKKESVSLGTLNRFELEKTVSFFEEKEKQFQSLQNRPLSLLDPGGKKSKVR